MEVQFYIVRDMG